MNRRIIVVLLTIIVITLTGCQLAVETVNEEGIISQDRLVGFVLTTEHLDLFDMEGYLEDNLNAILSGDNPDQSAYQGRLYAQEEIEETTTADGVPAVTKYYNFDHVDGIALLNYTAYTYLEDGTLHSEFSTGLTDEGLWDVRFASELTEGTVYLPWEGEDVIIYMNHVYQDSDGRLYLVNGHAMHSAKPVGEMAMNVHQEKTVTTDGQETTSRVEFKVNIIRTHISDQVVIVQMNGENQIITQKEYSPDTLPEELTSEADCAYIIVEQHASGEIIRQMLQPEDKYLTVYIREDKPYCLGNRMDIHWPETE